ncbi:MAG TPA: hypothetical protein VFW40_02760 [Capsulimonadaceae bacterium]|nr:hypothetical protein [Capsulimonadaceae bacterium]
MIKCAFRGRAVLSSTIVLGLVALSTFFLPQPSSQALPIFSRRYNVPCETCHSVPPALNAFGLAFQANRFNWPGGHGPGRSSSLLAFPVSAMGIYSSFHDLTGNRTITDFQNLQLFVSDGFHLGSLGDGGYFVDYVAAVKNGRAGEFGDAFLSLPVVRNHGQLSVTAGQFTPMMYQYDPLNSLTQSLPAALTEAVDGFSFTNPGPGVRLDYFSNQGRDTAEGNYISVGVPFVGLLTTNSDSKVDGANGVFLQAFHRAGTASLGLFGYDHSGHSIAGAMGTYHWRNKLYLVGAGQISHDEFGHTQVLSLEADGILSSQFAVTGRLETMNGEQSATFPVVGITYYPFRPQVIRLAAETTQERAHRSYTIFVFAQL